MYYNNTQSQSHYGQGMQYNQGAQKQSNPYWFRENAPYLVGVTNAPSNMSLGIQNIKLNPSSPAQQQYGILSNGILSTVIGTISFQVRLSKAGHPFVQTISTAMNDNQGGTRYWEHIMLNPQVKAQILRHFEAGFSQAQAPVQPQAQYHQPQPGYGHAPQYAMAQPVYQVQPEQVPVPEQPMAPANTELDGTLDMDNTEAVEEAVPENVDTETGEIKDNLPI